jgi:small GTP-binding protein
MAASPPSNAKDLLYKLLVIGPSQAGKTSVLRRYCMGIYTGIARATIACDFVLKVVQHQPAAAAEAPLNVTMQLCDIAGQDHNATMNRTFFKGAFGAVVVCDIIDPESYEKAIEWKRSVDKSVFFEGSDEPIPCVLMLNKCDLGPSPMSKAELNQFCQTHGFVGYFESSAKTNKNLEAPFQALVGKVIALQEEVKAKKGDAAAPAAATAGSGGRTEPVRIGGAKQKEKKDCPC